MNGTLTLVLLLAGAVLVYELVLKPKQIASASGNFSLGASLTGNANGVVL